MHLRKHGFGKTLFKDEINLWNFAIEQDITVSKKFLSPCSCRSVPNEFVWNLCRYQEMLHVTPPENERMCSNHCFLADMLLVGSVRVLFHPWDDFSKKPLWSVAYLATSQWVPGYPLQIRPYFDPRWSHGSLDQLSQLQKKKMYIYISYWTLGEFGPVSHVSVWGV